MAVLAVVIYHAGLPLPGGFSGVDVFFVISGFVITRMLVMRYSETHSLHLRNFFWRRFLRLAPALSLLLTVVLLLSIFILSPFGPQGNTALVGFSNLLLIANIGIARTTGGYFDQSATSNPLLNTWSLSVEEQFYIVYPLILLAFLYVLSRGRAGRALAFSFISALMVLSLALAVVGSAGVAFRGSQYLLGFYSPIPRVWEFLAGAATFLAISDLPRINMKLLSAFAAAGAVGLLVSFTHLTEWTPYPSIATVLPVASTVLLLLAGSSRSGLYWNVSSLPLLIWVGDRSYSIYLWHWPMIVFIATAIGTSRLFLSAAAAFSIIPAALSYKFVEEPMRRRQFPSRYSRRTFVLGVTVIPFLACLLLYSGNRLGWGSPSLRSAQADLAALHVGQLNGCSTFTASDWTRPREGCSWHSDSNGRPIYLIGDSNADMFSEAFIEAARIEGRRLELIMKPGCSFSPELELFEPSPQTSLLASSCEDFVEGLKETLITAPAGTVVISNTDDAFRQSSKNQPYAEANSRSYLTWLSELNAALVGVGHDLVVVEPIPKLVQDHESLWEPSSCSLPEYLIRKCTPVFTLQELQKEQNDFLTNLRTSADFGEFMSWDMSDAICPSSLCSPWLGGQSVYRDSSHISVSHSLSLKQQVLENLRETTNQPQDRS